MKSFSLKFLSSIKLSVEDTQSLTSIARSSGIQTLFARQSPETLRTLKSRSIVESTESSNRLEGIEAPRKRLRDLVLKDAAPNNRTEQEIAGYRDALAMIHESAADMQATVNVILQLHSMLYRYLPSPGGQWKMTDNQIVERDKQGEIMRVRFTPVSAYMTPQHMNDLFKGYQDAKGRIDPLISVPLMILDFLCIHPFSDGNGRVSRLLTLLLLYHANYNVGRYISLERIFEETKQGYYDSLEISSLGWHDGKHDVYPWLRYFWGVLIRAYGEFEERVDTIQRGKGSKTSRVEDAINAKIRPFSVSDLERDCPTVSRDMIRVVLKKLRDQGKIRCIGKGRGAKWIHTPN